MNYKALLKKYLTQKNFYIVSGLLIVGLFVWLAQYNHPSADDYSYTNDRLTLGFWKLQKHFYTGWTGRYFATLLLSSSPLLYHSFVGYKLIGFLLLSGLFYAAYFLNATLFQKLQKSDRLVLTLFLMLIFLSQMPSISQGFYWAAGALTYQLANILTLFLFTFIYLMMKTHQKKYLLLSVFLSFLIIGLNETSLLLTDFLVFLIFVVHFYNTKKIDRQLFVLLVFMFIFSLISVMAPGNFARAQHLPERHTLVALKRSYRKTVSMIMKCSPLLILLSILLFDYLEKRSKSKPDFFRIHPAFGLVLIPLVVFMGYFPGFWSLGHVPPGRTVNVIYFFFVMLSLFFLLTAYYYYQDKAFTFVKISDFVRYATIFVIFIMLLAHDNNIYIAYKDLDTERAYWYDVENYDRYRLIRKTQTDTVFLKPFHNRPKTLMFTDITKDPKHWRNMSYAKYWHKKVIVLKDVPKK